MSMNRICRLSHSIPVDQDRCSEGHPLAASLKCQVTNCNFVTDPILMNKINSAISLLNIHINAAHAHSKNNNRSDDGKPGDKSSESESDDEEKNKKTCPFCFKTFHSKLNMKCHRNAHHDGSKRHKCINCDKTFASKTSLNYHVQKNHAEGTMISCKKCGKDFSDLKTLKLHEKSHDPGKKKIFKCGDCNKIFGSSSNLRRHGISVFTVYDLL